MFIYRLQPRTDVFIKALVSKGVDSKDSLVKAWKADRNCE
jgi:hypothetical protein